MRIFEQAVARATPERVWELIADPSLHELWNPRIVATEIAGEPGIGSRYRVTYELSGKRGEFDAEILEFAPGSRFVARLEERHRGDGRHWRRFVEESYTLTPRGERTRILHEVRIHHSGVPWLVRALVWMLFRIGRPQGRTFIEALADLAEREEASRGKEARASGR